jgi:hypothetical protein
MRGRLQAGLASREEGKFPRPSNMAQPDEDKRVLRAVMGRMQQTDYRPTAQERAVLQACERRALQYGLAAGIASASFAALATRRWRAGLVSSIARTTFVAIAGSSSAVAGSAYTSDSCLKSLIEIASTSPLGGEAVHVLTEINPASPLLLHAPRAARWEPEALPRLPVPVSNAHVRARLADATAPRKGAEAQDDWGTGAAAGQAGDVFGALLSPAPSAAAGGAGDTTRDAPHGRAGSKPYGR